ncbi:hypothetical protein TRAPUB_5457 [Trametes pubescens]|uniref:F-box domain-containing protein n=1 Tax=Trametes pubescens TaxID=154538 RepID=A0A1M2V8L6_TRAPU|nr:hypothetical protein TRAPUB_5457 [Trametes pubescens]
MFRRYHHCVTSVEWPDNTLYSDLLPIAVDVDVFHLILECLPHADLLKITLASKFTREEATKELLMRPVRLLRNKNLRTFCRFALAGDPRRLSYLRNLTIEHIEKPFSSEDRETFADVLTRCTNLRKLELRWCDALLMEEHVVPEAISPLPNLTYLSAIMYKDSKESQTLLLRMVANMKSSLHSLHLPMIEDGLSKVEVLQDLVMVHGNLEEFTLQFSTFTAPGVTFSAVRDLHLTLEENVPRLRDLCSTFPSVRELSIDYHMHLGETPPDNTENSHLGDGSCWPSLDRLRASTSIIRILGIVCPVRRLDLGYYDSDLHDKIAETVSRLRPSKFTLNLYCAADWAAPRAHPSLLLHGSGDAGVRHLFVKTTFSSSRSPTTQDFMNCIHPLLLTARVELLHVAISELFTSDDPDEIVDPPMKVNPDVPTIDAEALAVDWAQACASIRTVAVTIALVGHTVWSVDRADGEARVVKLGAFEGRRVLDQEAQRCIQTSLLIINPGDSARGWGSYIMASIRKGTLERLLYSGIFVESAV